MLTLVKFKTKNAITMMSGILAQLKFCRNKHFTGKLCAISINGDTVDSLEGHCWYIYFYRGRLIGDSAGVHPLRRLRRQFSEQRVELSEQVENNILKSITFNYLSSDVINQLLADRYLEREQAEQILAGSLIEVLFDILHYEAIAQVTNKNQLSYILERDNSRELNVPNILMKPETIWEVALLQFKSWRDSGLLKCSPHVAPQINNLKLLQEILPVITFQKIVLLLEKDRSLRDLAVKIDEEIVVLTKSLMGLCNQDALVLRKIGDIDLVGRGFSTVIDEESITSFLIHGSENPKVFHKKLIVHLTQNPAESDAIQDVVERAGHHYLSFRESTQALITLLKCSPDLIVMDNSSAGMQAQDMCDRLRRTHKFKTTPIVLVSQKESMLERLRSSSIDYVSKPLNQQKIFSIMNKYIVQQTG
jgi:two-component system, chemotaxis family, response regulator PixG